MKDLNPKESKFSLFKFAAPIAAIAGVALILLAGRKMMHGDYNVLFDVLFGVAVLAFAIFHWRASAKEK